MKRFKTLDTLFAFNPRSLKFMRTWRELLRVKESRKKRFKNTRKLYGFYSRAPRVALAVRIFV